MTGIAQGDLSKIERGFNIVTERTKQKIEKAIGHIDWITNTNLDLSSANYYEAEKLVKKLIRTTALLDVQEKKAITSLITKYFKK